MKVINVKDNNKIKIDQKGIQVNGKSSSKCKKCEINNESLQND